MEVLLAFAFVSGIVTILSPCILPVLPVVLSGSTGSGRSRPVGVIIGFVSGFTFFTLALSSLVRALGIPPDALRIAAVVFIVLFGLVLVVPVLRNLFERAASYLAGLRNNTPSAGNQGARKPWNGLVSGIPIGLSLGLLWTPCVGPIMASVIGLAVSRGADNGAVLITLAYSLGTSIPMFAIMAGGRALLTRVPALVRNTGRIQQGFGVILILVGIGVGLGWDTKFQSFVLERFPGYGAGLTAFEDTEPVREALDRRFDEAAGPQAGETMTAMTALDGTNPAAGVFRGAGPSRPEAGVTGRYGFAPGFVTDGLWFNTEPYTVNADRAFGPSGDARQAEPASAGEANGVREAMPTLSGVEPADSDPERANASALTMEALRGKVVLIDFWTYSCINCVRTLPYLRAWYEEYRDDGFVIVGVHTPEFEFEKRPSNVERAMRDLGVTWPVVLDNEYEQWNAYANRYWPAHYFIDATGQVRYFHFGEGKYEESERVIKELLAEAGASTNETIVSAPDITLNSRTPETYLGYRRAKGFVSAEIPVRDRPASYSPTETPGNGEWQLEGTWTVAGQYIVPEREGRLELGFNARNVFLVIEPEQDGASVEVLVDGAPPPDTGDVNNGLLVPNGSRLYQLVGLERPGEHVLSLTVRGKLRLFAFTFG
jgi:cytochrome c biogenesis protein CcdA/thiol-disulfide isomerase/thioredoxin